MDVLEATETPTEAPVTALTPTCQAHTLIIGEPVCSEPHAYRSQPYCKKHYLWLYKRGLLPKSDAGKDTTKAGSLSSALKARAKLEENLEEYAKIHLASARKASEKGDSRPCEWAMLHARAIDPLEKSDTGPKVQVNVGIVLPGLGLEQAQAITVSATNDKSNSHNT